MFSYGQRSKCADLLNSYPTTYKWGSAADSCDSPSLRFSIDPPMSRIAPHCVLPQSAKIFIIRAFFYEKWLLIHIFAGPKVKNPLASKLASDFDLLTLVS